MDRQIRRLAYAIVALFVVLFGAVNYVQVYAAEELANNPANARLLIQEYDVARGRILGADGRTVLARSAPTGGRLKYLRRYPDGALFAHVTGYYSFVFGRSELEQSQNDFLAARAPELVPFTVVDQILGRDKQGADVVTTIEPRLQRVATQALGNRPGAVAAIDPQTGDVLALVSYPSYDPGVLSSHDGKEIRRNWRSLNDDPAKPLLSKANDELYPPGSTFKILIAAAALENGFGPDSRWPNPRQLALPLTTNTLKNFGGSHCLGGAAEITLAQALQVSCNVTFGQIGLELGAQRMARQAERFGLCLTDAAGSPTCDRPIPFDIPFEEAHFPEPSVFDQQTPQLAFSAIGQFDVAANPLHMALIAGAIGNDGVMMRPRLVREVRDPQGRIIDQPQPEEYGRALSSSSARRLTQMMVSVVEAGTATAARIPGVSVAGKTGTAQHAEGRDPHAWFVSFAPANDPQIAVAVVVLDGGDLGSEATGGAVAAPIARAVMQAAL